MRLFVLPILIAALSAQLARADDFRDVGAWDVKIAPDLKPSYRTEVDQALTDAKAALTRGLAAARKAEWDKAIERFEEAVRKTRSSAYMDWPHGMAPAPLLDLALVYDRQDRRPLAAAYLYRAYLAAAPDTKRAPRICAGINAMVAQHAAYSRDLLARAGDVLAAADRACTPRYCADYTGHANAAADYVAALVYAGDVGRARRVAQASSWDNPEPPSLAFGWSAETRRLNHHKNYARWHVAAALGEALGRTGRAAVARPYLQQANSLRTRTDPSYPNTVERIAARYATPRPHWFVNNGKGGYRQIGIDWPPSHVAMNEAAFWYDELMHGGPWRGELCGNLAVNCSHDRGVILARLRAIDERRRKAKPADDRGQAAIETAGVFARAALTAGVSLFLYRAVDRNWAAFWKDQGKQRPGNCP